MDERRLYKRYKLIVSVKYTDKKKKTEGKAETKNISTGGICISSHNHLAVNYFVNLEFSLPEKKIRALGKVVWSEQVFPNLYNNGIEFVEINEADKIEINKYVDRVTNT